MWLFPWRIAAVGSHAPGSCSTPTRRSLDDLRVWQKAQAATSGSSDDVNTSGIRAVKDFFKGLFGK
jgi:hypothetical protein